MSKITSIMDKIVFFCVVFVAFLVFFCDAVISYKNGDWWIFAINAAASASVAHYYFFDWRKKI